MKGKSDLPLLMLAIVVVAMLITGGYLGSTVAGNMIEVELKLPSTLTMVEAKLVTSEGYVSDRRIMSGSIVTFTMPQGQTLKWIQWNSDQTTAKTLDINRRLVSDTRIYASNGASETMVCSLGETSCDDTGDIYICAPDRLSYVKSTECPYGCNPTTKTCLNAPLEPPDYNGVDVPTTHEGQPVDANTVSETATVAANPFEAFLSWLNNILKAVFGV